MSPLTWEQDPSAGPGTPSRLPEVTIESLARGFFREAETYGFRQADYLRFMNCLLGMSMQAGTGRPPRASAAAPASVPAEALPLRLPLGDENVSVRPFERATDAPLLRRWLDDPVGRHFLLSRTVSRAWTLDDLLDGPTNVLGVICLPDGTPIGSTAYLDVDVDQHKAELRKLIGEPALRGRGYAKAATRLWIRYGLEGLRLRKIYLNTLDTNLRNIRLNEDLGFRVEGILHNEVKLDGRSHDVLRMALWTE